MNPPRPRLPAEVNDLISAYQIGLILVVALFTGAACGYAAALRGRFRAWAVWLAPVAACAVNLGANRLIAYWAPGADPWPHSPAMRLLFVLGMGAWGLLPAVAGAWLFQSHCRYANQNDPARGVV